MNRDDIVHMAREAGAMIPHITWLERDLFPVFMRFAERVAAAEREECAKVCEERGRANRYGAVVRLKIKECVDAIRARGKQK